MAFLLGAPLAGGCCSARIPVNAREFYQPHLHQFTERTVWHFIEEWLGKVSKLCASIPLLEIDSLCQEVEQEVRQRYRFFRQLAKCVGTLVLDQRIRVFPVREEEKACLSIAFQF